MSNLKGLQSELATLEANHEMLTGAKKGANTQAINALKAQILEAEATEGLNSDIETANEVVDLEDAPRVKGARRPLGLKVTSIGVPHVYTEDGDSEPKELFSEDGELILDEYETESGKTKERFNVLVKLVGYTINRKTGETSDDVVVINWQMRADFIKRKGFKSLADINEYYTNTWINVQGFYECPKGSLAPNSKTPAKNDFRGCSDVFECPPLYAEKFEAVYQGF